MKGASTKKSGGDKPSSTRANDVSMRSDISSSHPTAVDLNVLETIPSDYLRKPDTAEPILHYLPKMVANNGMVMAGSGTIPTPNSAAAAAAVAGGGNNKFVNFRVLLAAAEDDIRLHRARQQAGKYRDSRLLKTYKIETDQNWLARQQRLNERDLLLGKLGTERGIIMKELLDGTTSGLTAKEATAIQLARWQRALELYVYDPPPPSTTTQSRNGPTTATTSSTASSGQDDTPATVVSEKAAAAAANVPTNLDFLGLLEKLMETTGEVGCQNIGTSVCLFASWGWVGWGWVGCIFVGLQLTSLLTFLNYDFVGRSHVRDAQPRCQYV
jgi:hypothetical protein